MKTLKNAMVGFGVVALIVVGAWLVLLGVHSPCDALRLQAAAAADTYSGPQKEAVAKGIRDNFANFSDGRYNPVECAAMSVRLKLQGASAINTVVVDK